MRFPLLPILLLPALTAGCTPIFNDTFEADPANGAPLADPPGAPMGDSVEITTGAIYVTTALPLEGAQSLRIDGPGSPRVFMRGAPITDQTKTLFLSWKGRIGSGAEVRILVGFESDKVPLRLDFEDGIVFANGNSIGTYSGTSPHGVFVSLNPMSDTWSVILSGSATTGTGAAATGAFNDPEDFPGFHVTLVAELRNARTAVGYWMDDVRISHFRN